MSKRCKIPTEKNSSTLKRLWFGTGDLSEDDDIGDITFKPWKLKGEFCLDENVI